jgi:hypothetical protein
MFDTLTINHFTAVSMHMLMCRAGWHVTFSNLTRRPVLTDADEKIRCCSPAIKCEMTVLSSLPHCKDEYYRYDNRTEGCIKISQ